MGRLGNEIKAFERFIKLTPAEMRGTQRVALRVQDIVKSTLKDSSCEVVGSYSSGLALPFSDVDFSVTLPAVESRATTHRKSLSSLAYQKLYRNALHKLRRAFLMDHEFRHDAEYIYARVPIVRTTHRMTGQEVQIQMWSGTRRQEQYTLAYLSEYPMLRPLYFVLRSCLRMRSLGRTYEGGLGSYATLMLAVNALKHGAGQYDRLDVGSQLLYILDFYAKSDLYHYGFSVDPPLRFHKGQRYAATEDPTLSGIGAIAKINAYQPYLLCLQDPADPTNDLGKKAYAIKHIQETFFTARKIIERYMRGWDSRSGHDSKSMADRALLVPLVQANYTDFNARRAKIDRHGSLHMERGCTIHRPLRTPGKRCLMSAREMLAMVIKVDERKAAESANLKSHPATGETSNDPK
ncbi:MAG: hypothetical protein Q9218_000248 [Villophora microphyllina]